MGRVKGKGILEGRLRLAECVYGEEEESVEDMIRDEVEMK